jgi:hypothetical protein
MSNEVQRQKIRIKGRKLLFTAPPRALSAYFGTRFKEDKDHCHVKYLQKSS